MCRIDSSLKSKARGSENTDWGSSQLGYCKTWALSDLEFSPIMVCQCRFLGSLPVNHWRLHCESAESMAETGAELVDRSESWGVCVDSSISSGSCWDCSRNFMTSHQRACSTVLFTYSKDWCSFWIRSLMASASAWTEAFACASTFFFETLWECSHLVAVFFGNWNRFLRNYKNLSSGFKTCLADFRGNYVMTYDMIQCERHPSQSNVHSAEFRFWTQLGEKNIQKPLKKMGCILGRG